MKEQPAWVKRTVDSYSIRLPIEAERPVKREKKLASRKVKG